MKKLMMFFLAVSFLALAGCDTVDSKLDLPEGRNSTNSRFEDEDIVGPVLKLRLKETPEQQKKQEELLNEQSLDEDY